MKDRVCPKREECDVNGCVHNTPHERTPQCGYLCSPKNGHKCLIIIMSISTQLGYIYSQNNV